MENVSVWQEHKPLNNVIKRGEKKEEEKRVL